MKESDQKLILSFIAGAATGAAVTSFLQSDTGQETVRRVKTELNQLEGEFEDRMKRHLNEVQNSLEELVNETSHRFESATEEATKKATQRIDKLKDEARKVTETAKAEASEATSSKSKASRNSG